MAEFRCRTQSLNPTEISTHIGPRADGINKITLGAKISKIEEIEKAIDSADIEIIKNTAEINDGEIDKLALNNADSNEEISKWGINSARDLGRGGSPIIALSRKSKSASGHIAYSSRLMLL